MSILAVPMPSDHDLARQFIAERLAERRGHGGVWHGDLLDATAILDTPGVEVREEWGVRFTRSTDGKVRDERARSRADAEGWVADVNQEIAAHGSAWQLIPSLIHRSVLITPWESAQRSGVAAHQHTEEQQP
jgi:hypothetical protein